MFSESDRVAVFLTQELCRPSGDVVLLAATNRIDIIDSAVLRRFSKSFAFPLFTSEELESMLVQFLDNVSLPYSSVSVSSYASLNAGSVSNGAAIKHATDRIADALISGKEVTL